MHAANANRMRVPKIATLATATFGQLIACAKWHEAAATTGRGRARAAHHRAVAARLRDAAHADDVREAA
ncbi:MAG: hypothetical protein FD152_2048 [Xanthobacteraceae bacterium]|nr:MAG: hypothetical protein FD152_2048 [Xanthobacteraceae bacterium]